MCFELDSVPPIPAVGGAAVEHRDLTLTAADGTEFAAFEALADVPGGAAVVVLPDVRGLYRFYEELALRLAEAGYDTVALDYFGRTAGVGKRDDEFDYMTHVRQATQEGVRQDVAAAVAHLRDSDPGRAIFTMGFCFGGSNSWHQAASGHGLAGAIGFYGHPDRPGFPLEAPGVIDRIDDIECPLLGLMGGADPGIPQDEVEPFLEAMAEAGKSTDFTFYHGAPHSFFDRAYEEFAAESRNAWHRCLGFIAAHE